MDWNVMILGYLILINLFGAAVAAHDKRMARKRKWRIPEFTLLLVCVLGGSVGMYLTMKKIRHKTQKKKFMIGIPVIFLVQMIAAIGAFCLFSNFIKI